MATYPTREPTILKAIIDFLKEVPCASTRYIARAIKKNYSNVHAALNKLKAHNLVGDIYVKEYFPFRGRYIEVRYWYLKGKRKEAIRWLKSDSHISLSKKPKYWRNLLSNTETSTTGNSTSD